MNDAMEQGVLLEFQIGHIGFHFDSDDQACREAGYLSQLFGLPLIPGKPSLFVGDLFECVKPPCPGRKGHVAIRTNDIESAVAYLEGKGVEFLDSSRQYNDDGGLRTIYLKEEIGGFAIHLLQK